MAGKHLGQVTHQPTDFHDRDNSSASVGLGQMIHIHLHNHLPRRTSNSSPEECAPVRLRLGLHTERTVEPVLALLEPRENQSTENIFQPVPETTGVQLPQTLQP